MTTSEIIFAIIIGLIVLVLGPLCTIWALNTIFPVLAIPYTFDTWAAIVVLKGLFTVSINKKD